MSFRRLYEGSKVKRKKAASAVAKPEYSTVSSGEHKFTLLPGKARDNLPATFLGKGDYGRVKQARDEKGNLLAVKIIKIEDVYDSEEYKTSLNELKNELRCLEKMGDRTPHLIIVGKKAYLFQALIDGKPLLIKDETNKKHGGYFNEILQKILEAKEVDASALKLKMMDILLKIIDAIYKMHSLGLVHRDLHLYNVLFDEKNNQIKIIDFGQALASDCEEEEIARLRPHEEELCQNWTFDKLKFLDLRRFFAALLNFDSHGPTSLEKQFSILMELPVLFTSAITAKETADYDKIVNNAKQIINQQISIIRAPQSLRELRKNPAALAAPIKELQKDLAAFSAFCLREKKQNGVSCLLNHLTSNDREGFVEYWAKSDKIEERLLALYYASMDEWSGNSALHTARLELEKLLASFVDDSPSNTVPKELIHALTVKLEFYHFELECEKLGKDSNNLTSSTHLKKAAELIKKSTLHLNFRGVVFHPLMNNMIKCDFRTLDFTGARFGSRFSECDFSEASLYSCKFLPNADFCYCWFPNADLRKSSPQDEICDIRIAGCTFFQAIMDDNSRLTLSKIIESAFSSQENLEFLYSFMEDPAEAKKYEAIAKDFMDYVKTRSDKPEKYWNEFAAMAFVFVPGYSAMINYINSIPPKEFENYDPDFRKILEKYRTVDLKVAAPTSANTVTKDVSTKSNQESSADDKKDAPQKGLRSG